jgi:hypothetical protein
MNSAPTIPTTKKDFLEIMERVIDYGVMYNEDLTTDDMLVDMMADQERRQDALDMILDWLVEEEGYNA